MKDDIYKKLAEFESPGSMLGDILDDGAPLALECGFPSVQTGMYLRAGQPDLVIIAARPGQGKSAMLCQLAYNIAEYGAAHLFSIEMDRKQVRGRFMRLADGGKLADRRLFVDDTNGIDANTLYSRAAARHKVDALSAVFVDYIQVVGSTGRSKAEEVEGVARKLKQLALELKCPVIVAAQMSRNIEGRLSNARDRSNVVPLMSDLGDSSALEKWADVVIFLRKRYVNGAESNDLMTAYVAKNRHGRQRDFNLRFEGAKYKFHDMGFQDEGGI